MQYLITAIAFSISKPFRKPIYSNYILCVFIILTFAYSTYIIVDPDSFSQDLFGIVSFVDNDFNYYVLIFSLVNFIVSYVVEKSVIPCITNMWKNYKLRKLREKIAMEHEYNLNQLYRVQRS